MNASFSAKEHANKRLRMEQGLSQKGGLKRVFGRVVSDPSIKAGRPLLRTTLVEVLDVLDMMRLGFTDKEICATHHFLTPEDMDACRAYQARFLVDELSSAFGLQDNNNVLMLDENISYLILPDIIKLFGKSSHVFAEGLYADRNDDEKDIWSHVVENNYQAILTSDNDFKHIARRYNKRTNEFEPKVIFVSKNLSRLSLIDTLKNNADDIKAFLENETAMIASLTKENGLTIIHKKGDAKPKTLPSPAP